MAACACAAATAWSTRAGTLYVLSFTLSSIGSSHELWRKEKPAGGP